MQNFCWPALLGLLMLSTVRGNDQRLLQDALTHHASFDETLQADFSRGDPVLYSYTNPDERAEGGQVAQSDAALSIAPGAGRFGGALLRDTKSSVRIYYRGPGILSYRTSSWSGTVSIWLRTNPDVDLPPGYCDPVQITGPSNKQGFIFLEWSRDHQPRKFRFAILPRRDLWNPDDLVWDEIPIHQRPMVEVSRAPFSRAVWTHVVFTFDSLNASRSGRGKLYLNGKLQGTIADWDFTFGWTPESVQLELGASFVGHIDDLAVFDRALTEDEIRILHDLSDGIASLR